ncbi:MAG: hypothetical protein F4X82_01730 [Candidatus Spechtbacteria bacterium SB0662_bin_43]|uniref:Uncharacterized protein n=1 Tax=Candidatus Spechtbacteria bacterium SB0662_bin_43 TaxID=2604897 RepID=A0A845D9Q4_9BACT|nr:hypothetical protein [Candidatus Spechtbacteria bacterium SB0662_bin_43]
MPKNEKADKNRIELTSDTISRKRYTNKEIYEQMCNLVDSKGWSILQMLTQQAILTLNNDIINQSIDGIDSEQIVEFERKKERIKAYNALITKPYSLINQYESSLGTTAKPRIDKFL